MLELLTISEYARQRGVSQQAVSKAVKAGRITTIEKDGKKLIDPEVANIQWAKNTRIKTTNIDHVLADDLGKSGTGIEADVFDIKQARAKREYHEANIAEMRERKEKSELVEFDYVRKAAIEVGSILRHSLEQMPGKLGVRLAAIADPADCRSVLAHEIDLILSDLSENLRRIIRAD